MTDGGSKQPYTSDVASNKRIYRTQVQATMPFNVARLLGDIDRASYDGDRGLEAVYRTRWEQEIVGKYGARRADKWWDLYEAAKAKDRATSQRGKTVKPILDGVGDGVKELLKATGPLIGGAIAGAIAAYAAQRFGGEAAGRKEPLETRPEEIPPE